MADLSRAPDDVAQLEAALATLRYVTRDRDRLPRGTRAHDAASVELTRILQHVRDLTEATMRQQAEAAH